jgi:hypothetical protein
MTMMFSYRSLSCILLLSFISVEEAAVLSLDPSCANGFKGIYLQYDSNLNIYAFTSVAPHGDFLTTTSNAEMTIGNFNTDLAGFYGCTNDLSEKGTKYFSSSGIGYGQSGNNVLLVKVTATCTGAPDDSSRSNAVCNNAVSTTQRYKYQSATFATGQFVDPIGPPIFQRFQALRLYFRSIVNLSLDTSKYYAEMSGLYVARNIDNSFSLTAVLPSGYLYKLASNARNADNTFNFGTTVGKLSCN